MEDICFSEGSVPVCIAAKVYGKDASWIRAGIIVGWLPIGKATRKGRIVTRIEEMDSNSNITRPHIGRLDSNNLVIIRYAIGSNRWNHLIYDCVDNDFDESYINSFRNKR